MSPERLAENDAAIERMIAEMPLHMLREARQITQAHLAEILGVKQSSISKMESRADIHVSTLARVIEAMGGELEIRARFPDGSVVRIKKFSDAA